MISRTNEQSFMGRYVMYGTNQEVLQAANEIKKAKGKNVDFFCLNQNENRYVIVATDEDAIIMKKKKEDKNFSSEIKAIISKKIGTIPNIVKYIFNTTSDTLIVRGEYLKKFITSAPSINFSDGSRKSKYKIEEEFIDGTVKKYNTSGRLYEIKHPDGTIEKRKGTSAKIARSSEDIEMPPIKTKTSAPSVESEKFIIEMPIRSAKKQTQKAPHSEVTNNTANSSAQKEARTTQTNSSPIRKKSSFIPLPEIRPRNLETKTIISQDENGTYQDTIDKKGKLLSRKFESGIVANYYYKGSSDEILFTYYSDGKFESDEGIVDQKAETITFPFKDGIKQVIDKHGTLISLIYPDGTIKNFSENQSLINKILPDGTKELYNSNGSRWCIEYPDGTKKYTRYAPI